MMMWKGDINIASGAQFIRVFCENSCPCSRFCCCIAAARSTSRASAATLMLPWSVDLSLPLLYLPSERHKGITLDACAHVSGHVRCRLAFVLHVCKCICATTHSSSADRGVCSWIPSTKHMRNAHVYIYIYIYI